MFVVDTISLHIGSLSLARPDLWPHTWPLEQIMAEHTTSAASRNDSTESPVSVTDLRFTYPHSPDETLRGLSFSVGPGNVYGFLGPSGAGKSTTQKILYRLVSGYSGCVRVAGREVREWSGALYSRMGIGFETPNLYLKLTGRENLEFALALHESARRRDGEMPAPAANADIDSAAKRMGLDTALDTRVETWSKGMRMRLAFIRAVIHEPQLLFLDEPTSGLDPMWARRMKDWILEIRGTGAAVFLTTHSMELADELCDTVGFLVDGELVTEGSPAELRQRFGRGGVTVHGVDQEGRVSEVDVSYEDLVAKPVEGLSRITRVVNHEVSLAQVFLEVTGRSLGEGG